MNAPFNEMQKALKAMAEARGDRAAELREILFGSEKPYQERGGNSYELPDLNPLPK